MQKILVKPNKYFPELKRVRQKTDAFCGPAVVEMLASFEGIYVNQNKLVKVCKFEKKIAKYGLNINDLAKATKKMIPNGVFWYKNKSTAKDLDDLINKYHVPVGIEWQGVFHEYTDKNFPDDGHYSVVTHINRHKNKILVADPFRRFAKIDREFKLDFFKKRWWDINEVEEPKTKKIKVAKDEHMIFIITSKEAVFPLKIGMIKA